ncbi:hypothetical protein PCC7424_5810 (plasmid) [Gloeothece citriformis PCC 7424]|uniref:Transposase n=1 Tax=Gloeothece citriformis (strain PCC 7424) TaxID=65393 RepID=B7KM49_GLOC7|nr:hypothetical protein [Gloeothece citriformis]ACK73871.1 hypothetical protein PCC7424_5810 [Gloeothece citriformis PCC 7424]
MNPQSIHHLQRKIKQIRASGEVAPDNTWIAAYTVPKPSGKRYTYYRLMNADGKRSNTGAIQGKMCKYLGNESNPKYKEMKEAIARRNKIHALERKLKRLQAMDKKRTSHGAPTLFPPVSSSMNAFSSPPLTSTNLDLKGFVQLQQQVHHLMEKFERLEGEVKQLKIKGE